MADHKFRKFEIEHGTYYLVPKAELDAILNLTPGIHKVHITRTEPPTFGQLLHLFRKSKKLTLEQLAAEANVKLRTLKDQEAGGAKPQKANLDRLCDFFGSDFENQLPEELKKLRDKKAA